MTICIFMYIFPQKHIFLYFLQFRVHVSLLMQMGWVSLRANHSPVELHIISLFISDCGSFSPPYVSGLRGLI